jgi:hypothetical protein
MDDERPKVRFPYVGACLCAACVGMAAWLWFRYTHCWEARPDDFRGKVLDPDHPLLGRYVRLRGELVPRPGTSATNYAFVRETGRQTEAPEAVAVRVPFGPYEHRNGEVAFEGRPDWRPTRTGARLVLETRTGPWTGQTVAGLVVGAMGVFVFGTAVRHWLRERRRFRESAG